MASKLRRRLSRKVRIFRSLEEAALSFGPSAVTIGNFDGVHRGHVELMRHVVEMARRHNTRPSVLTFHPHPTQIVAPERAPKLLMTPEERAALIAEQGIEQVLILPFTAEVAALSPAAFFDQILLHGLGARGIVVGDNFHFGQHQAGNIATLSALGAGAEVEIDIVPGVYCRGALVSSSEIRRLVRHGRVTQAERLLGRSFSLRGAVVRGAGRGSRQTVPTLNLEPTAELLPLHGVYVTRTVDLDSPRRWHSITNVGVRPTFDGRHVTVESFLLGKFDGDTPARIRVDFFCRLRDERKFESAEELKAQIFRDVTRAEKWFRRYRRFVRKSPMPPIPQPQTSR